MNGGNIFFVYTDAMLDKQKGVSQWPIFQSSLTSADDTRSLPSYLNTIEQRKPLRTKPLAWASDLTYSQLSD